MSWKRLASILWNSIAILYGILVLAGIGVGLFVDTKGTLIRLAFMVSFLVVLGVTYYCLEEIKYRREDWGLYPDLDSLLEKLQFTTEFLLWVFLWGPFYDFIDLEENLEHIEHNLFENVNAPLAFLSLLAFSMLAYYSLVLKWRNAIFYARSYLLSLVVFILAMLYMMLSEYTGTKTWEDFAGLSCAFLLFLWICSYAIKGFMVTFGTNAQKVFPNEKRNTKWYEVFLALFLAFSPLVIGRTHLDRDQDHNNSTEQKNATEQVEIKERTTDGMLNN